jgi:thiol-disulfide isomerase/thioredoxin
MSNQDKKNYTPIVVGGISLLLVLAALGYFFLIGNTSDNTSSVDNTSTSENSDGSTDSSTTDKKIEGYSGDLLAGDKSPLLAFEKADYDKAVKSDKLVVLYFYANWCPICREEFPKMGEAFDELDNENLIGFRVNYNDNETDEHEKALASEFGVAYQHTKVFLKNGERVLKSPESWEKDRYISEINKAL